MLCARKNPPKFYLSVNGTQQRFDQPVGQKAPTTFLRNNIMDILGNIRTWNRVRQTRNELSSLSNRELDDLGITRGDIPYIAQRAAGKK